MLFSENVLSKNTFTCEKLLLVDNWFLFYANQAAEWRIRGGFIFNSGGTFFKGFFARKAHFY